MDEFKFKIPVKCGHRAGREGQNVCPRYYLQQSEWEFNAIKPYIGRPSKVLDLGCGLGRVAVYLNSHWRDKSVEYILADGNEVSRSTPSKYGSNCSNAWDFQEPDFYNDMDLTAKFCQANGLTNFKRFNLQQDNWDDMPKIDLVISFLAVGFHFPIEHSMDKLLKATSDECTMIFGVRKGKYQINNFRDLFKTRILIASEGHGVNSKKQHFLILKDRIAP